MDMYILDTNVFYDFVNPNRVDQKMLAQIQERAVDGLFCVAYSPITIIELASRIHDEPQWFDRVKNSIKAVLEMKAECLPDPESLMEEIVKDLRMPYAKHNHWRDVIYTISCATDRKSLINGFDDYGTCTRRQVYINFISNFRINYENFYIDSLLEVTKNLNPKYEYQIRKGKQTKFSKHEQNQLNQFLSSAEWERIFLDMIAYRSKSSLPVDRGARKIILRRINFFKQAYEYLLRNIFCDGYQPNMKKKNDFNDIHLFLYLDDFNTNVLVSSENKFKKMIDNSRKKVITVEEFLTDVVNKN